MGLLNIVQNTFVNYSPFSVWKTASFYGKQRTAVIVPKSASLFDVGFDSEDEHVLADATDKSYKTHRYNFRHRSKRKWRSRGASCKTNKKNFGKQLTAPVKN